jgi:endonuclease YncB( thermonuclease family)
MVDERCSGAGTAGRRRRSGAAAALLLLVASQAAGAAELSPAEEAALALACRDAGEEPPVRRACRERELRELERVPRPGGLDRLPPGERARLDAACARARAYGPAELRRCLALELRRVAGGPAPPAPEPASPAVAPAPASDPGRGPLRGPGAVVDGDTLEVGGVRVRLWGVAAPALGQSCAADGRPYPCGREAAAALAGRVAGREVTCAPRGPAPGPGGEVAAVCAAGEEQLNAWAVEAGWALAFREESAAYGPQEARARQARRGLWRGEFELPWERREP